MKKLFSIRILLLLCMSMLQGGVYAQGKASKEVVDDSMGDGIYVQSKTIEGVAVDSKGVPLPDGKRSITFLIYDEPEGVTPLWSEQQMVVIKNGAFTAKLGSIIPFDLPDDQQYWLGLRVEGGKELSPRLSLSPVADRLKVGQDFGIDGVTAVGGTFIITFIDGDTGNLNLTANIGGEVTVNDASEDVDFRVETDNRNNTLFVDGANDRVGLRASNPASVLDVRSAGSITSPIFSVSGTTQDTYGVFLSNIMNSGTDFDYAIRIEPQAKGNAQVGAVNFSPFVWASGGPHTNVYGTNYETRYKGSATILNAWSSFFRSKTEADFTGNITNLRGLGIAAAVYNGSGKPTNVYGVDIQNQGTSGITNNYGLRVLEQSGATNNWNIFSQGTTSRNYFEGNVGIGTGATTPAAKLVVRSSTGTNLIEAYNDAGGGIVFRVERTTGNVYADGSFNGGGADVAEFVPMTEPVEPGDVIEIDPHNPGKFRKTVGPMSMRVAGIITTKPGVVLGGNSVHPDRQDGHPAVALAGRVPVKVMAKYGAIEIGDLLVSSPFPGYAMKCEERGECVGAIVGKAMEPLKAGTGKIMVQVMLR